jgi:hypothetical protein
MTADFGEKLSVSLVYFHDVNNAPGVLFSPAPVPTANVLLTHNEQNVYGGYFTYQFQPLDIIIRGEFAKQTDMPITLPGVDPYSDHGVKGLATFRYKPVTLWMLAIDKNMLVPWIAPHQNTSFGVQWIHKQINNWEDIFELTPRNKGVAKDVNLLTFQLGTFWFRGTVAPSLFVIYNPGTGGDGGGSAMSQVAATWYLTKQLYTKFAVMAFWGDKDAKSSFAPLIDTSETTLKLVYEW